MASVARRWTTVIGVGIGCSLIGCSDTEVRTSDAAAAPIESAQATYDHLSQLATDDRGSAVVTASVREGRADSRVDLFAPDGKRVRSIDLGSRLDSPSVARAAGVTFVAGTTCPTMTAEQLDAEEMQSCGAGGEVVVKRIDDGGEAADLPSPWKGTVTVKLLGLDGGGPVLLDKDTSTVARGVGFADVVSIPTPWVAIDGCVRGDTPMLLLRGPDASDAGGQLAGVRPQAIAAIDEQGRLDIRPIDSPTLLSFASCGATRAVVFSAQGVGFVADANAERGAAPVAFGTALEGSLDEFAAVTDSGRLVSTGFEAPITGPDPTPAVVSISLVDGTAELMKVGPNEEVRIARSPTGGASVISLRDDGLTEIGRVE